MILTVDDHQIVPLLKKWKNNPSYATFLSSESFGL